MITENKKDTRVSRLVGDPRVARKLLKKNGEIKFCPICGELITNNCACHKNIIVDVKPNKSNPEKSVFIFQNSEAFKADFEEITAEMKAKEKEKEPIEADMD
jgi:hypothetical protein